MKAIMLIRHGEAVHMVTGLTGGWTDTGLTDLGRRQAGLLAKRLARDIPADIPRRMICSDLKRTTETARIVGDELGHVATPARELREFGNGIAAGMTEEESQRYLMPRVTESEYDWRPFEQGETWREFHYRVAGFLETITRDQNELLMLVTHGGAIIHAVMWWLRLDFETQGWVHFDAAPTSITVLRTDEGGRRIVAKLNDDSHLWAQGMAEEIQFGPR